MFFWSIDRFEGDQAVCIGDDGAQRLLARALLPPNAREGDLLYATTGGGYQLDSAETALRRAANAARLSPRVPRRLNAEERRQAISEALTQGERPQSASALAERFGVSRQVVVGDVALLRAAGLHVLATPRGYLLRLQQTGLTRTVACRHSQAQMADELLAVVELGGQVLDVTVEHPVYGQLLGQLEIGSREDVESFVSDLAASTAAPLSALTGGVHLHTLLCPDEETFLRITAALSRLGVLFEGDGARF